ncbi:RecD ATP-dependent exoDNAse (exonuclease V), alpha subunit - helicase superfamily I member [Comamonadaceae bacterium]
MKVQQTLRVTSIRSQSPSGFGGCIFTGKPIDDQGKVQDAAAYYVVKANATAVAKATVQLGQWWTVSGEAIERVLDVNGYKVTELQIEASEAVLTRPSGEHIVSFIADNPAFEGIGQVKARKLWDCLGVALYDALDSADVDLLAKVLTLESATQVVGAWAQFGDSRTLQWLQSEGIDLEIGQKVLKFFGRETPEKLQEDPYRLLSFCARWRHVDALAISHFGVALDDPRRLQGAIEEACYRVFSAGHTMVLSATLMDYLQGVFGAQTKTFRWRGLIPAALTQGFTNGSFVVGHHGLQPLGALVMERQVAQAVLDRLDATDTALMSSTEVDDALRKYETNEGIELNAEQRHAVHLATERSFVLITGGAGVGKTTVLKALYKVYDQTGVEVVQLALAGRAAKRMQEATGRAASTIAGFLGAAKELAGACVVVVDEASMVDIVTMHRLVELLGPEVRLVLAGDPEQLMPVGPGLVLHALIRVPSVPLAELKVIKRYGGDIAAAAIAIRKGIWPSLSDDESGAIAFVHCEDSRTATGTSLIAETVLDLYKLDPANTQILSGRRNGSDGVKTINSLCQANLTKRNKPMIVWSAQHDQMMLTGFHLGDPILCTRNLWDRGLQNGSLGVIVEVNDASQALPNEDASEAESTLAWVLWDDGVRRPVVNAMLDDLELGYAITVHKAQGSQWPRVIVPLTGHRLLDRTLIYTAVTRAQQQVLIVGDEAAARAAVERPPRVQARQVALDLLLKSNK